jgi:excisionase family DNA binding protein
MPAAKAPEGGCLVYDIEEVAKILGVGRNSAYEAAKRGDFPTIRIGKRIKVPKAALARLLEQAGAGTPARD